MAVHTQRLVWLDMEMTGLDPDKERIIEVAVVVTEADLTLVAEGPVLVVHQSNALLDGMDAWNKGDAWPQRPDRQGQSFHLD